MKRGAWIPIVGAFASIGCLKIDPEPPMLTPSGVVHLMVRPRWDTYSFNKTVTYTNVLAQRVLVQQLRFFLADIRLVSSGEGSLMKDADLFDLTEGPVERWYRVDPGSYHHLHFGIGLPYDLNHTDPSDYPVNDPLGANNGMYWDWAALHKFLIISGHYDTLPGSGLPPFPFNIEPGFDTCYRETQLPVALEIGRDDTVELVLDMDLSRFFHNATDTFDLTQQSQWHGDAGSIGVPLKLMDMVAGSFNVH